VLCRIRRLAGGSKYFVLHLLVGGDETKGVLHRISMRGINFRKAAVTGLPKSTLHRLSHKIIKLAKARISIEKEFHHHQTFTPEEENELALYLIVSKKLNLTPRKTR
jgi:hypothetical protein